MPEETTTTTTAEASEERINAMADKLRATLGEIVASRPPDVTPDEFDTALTHIFCGLMIATRRDREQPFPAYLKTLLEPVILQSLSSWENLVGDAGSFRFAFEYKRHLKEEG